MKIMTLRTASIAIGFMLSSTALQAMDTNHEELNLNADGKVTKSEVLSIVKNHLSKAKENSKFVTDIWESEN